MTNFEFVFSLLVILLGLGLAEVFGGLARVVKERPRVQIGWATGLLATWQSTAWVGAEAGLFKRRGVDMTLPAEGVFHNLVFVSIRKQYPYQAFKVMHGLWGMGQMMFSKYIVAVDEDCDVHNTSDVLFRLCANTDPARDTTIIKNPSDSLDHAPSQQNIGSHMGFDATRKLPGENYHRPWPELIKMTDEARAIVNALQRKTEAAKS